MRRILIFIPEGIVEVDKYTDVKIYFMKKKTECKTEVEYEIADFVLTGLESIGVIQVYSDNVIRLHLMVDHHSPKKSVFIHDVAYGAALREMLLEIIS